MRLALALALACGSAPVSPAPAGPTVHATCTPTPGGARIEVTIDNPGSESVWVVHDDWFTWKTTDSGYELSLAREPMQPGIDPFGYFDPKVREVAAGGELVRTVELQWPHKLSGLWNSAREANPPSGEHPLVVRIGYGTTRKPEHQASDGVETAALRWQSTATSKACSLSVP